MTDIATTLKNVLAAIAAALGRALTSTEKSKIQQDLGLTKKPIGYFVDSNQTPLDKISFTEWHKRGIDSLAFRVTNDGTNGLGVDKLDKVQKTLDSAKIPESLAWVWCNEDSQFTKTKQVAQSQFDGLLVDSETYNPDKVLPYLKQIVKDAGNKEVIVCTKPQGWDGEQGYDNIMALDKRVKIAPMTYIDDYGKTIAELKAFYKSLYAKYPDRIIGVIETYKGDNNPSPKTNTQIQAEIDAVMPYVVGILLFRYGLSNYMTKDVAKGNTTTTPTTGTVQSKIQKSIEFTFTNFTQFYNWIKQNADYSYYFDNKYTLQQEIDRKVTLLNCVDFAQVGAKLAREMGYNATLYGVYCTSDQINHAIFKIKGKEFTNETWIDLAAAASDNYSIGNHWCSGGYTKEPSWLPYE